jgi:hypothetical protein
VEPIVVSIPHRYGRPEAVRRVKAAIDAARTRYAAELKIAEENWVDDRLQFRAAVLGQTVSGTIDVTDDDVRVEVILTWLMGHLVKATEALIRQEGERALEIET